MQINTQSIDAQLLVKALRANGVFSMLSGIVILLIQQPLANWFGQINPLYLAGLGIGLILFALRLLYLAGPGQLFKLEAQIIIGSDIGWVAGSLVLLAAFYRQIAIPGILLMLAIALVVGGFAFMQTQGLRRLT